MEMTKDMKRQAFKDAIHRNGYSLEEYVIKDGRKHPFALICPGGGYFMVCSFIEGIPFAEKLNELGYSAFILRYHCRKKAAFPTPQDDVARAVADIMERAEELGIEKEGYSVWGSSAGGHLAASFGTESMGYVKYGLPKPGAMVLVYSVITMGEKTHMGSRDNLLGKTPTAEMIEKTSIELQVNEKYPPTFVWCGLDDHEVPPDNSRMMETALNTYNVPCQRMEFEGIDHGVGLAQGTVAEEWFQEAVKFWEKQR